MNKYIDGISKIFLVGLVTTLLFLLLIGKFDSCKNNPTIPTTTNELTKKLIDSLTAFQSKSKTDSVRLFKKIDSISFKYRQKDSSLNSSRAKVKYLSSELEKAKLVLDTASYFHFCDELVAENKILDNEISGYKIQVDTLLKAKDSLQLITQKKADDYLNLMLSFKRVSKQLTGDNDSLIAVNKKLLKKANKNFSIGVGGSVGLTSFGTPGASIGLTIQRTFIRL